ncbi:Sympk [Linum perenne]
MSSRDQALSLLGAARTHPDVAVKVSSLKQARRIMSVYPSLTVELFPYLVDLQYSPDNLVRKVLLEIIEELGMKAIKHCHLVVPVLLVLLRDADPAIARESVASGIHLFCAVLEEMVFHFHQRGIVERWLEELWIWMLKFKDSVFSISLEPGSIGPKLLALKFLETYILLFTPDMNDSDKTAVRGSRRLFNISRLGGYHPVLDPVSLISDANRTLGILLDFLGSPGSLRGSLTIAVVNCLASIARKRPIHYSVILSVLLNFDPNSGTAKGCHTASVQYSLRTAFLGFLRSTNPTILESRDRLLMVLRAINAGDAADQVVRQVDKIIKNTERSSRESRFSKDDQQSSLPLISMDQSRKRTVPLDTDESVNGHEVSLKRSRYGPNDPSSMPAHINHIDHGSLFGNGTPTNAPVVDDDLTPAEQMIAMIGALLAEGDRGAESLEILISNIHPDLLADIVITNMKHLPKTLLSLPKLRKLPTSHQLGSQTSTAQVITPSITTQSASALVSQAANISSLSDASTINSFLADSKRDPRRDPRRLDPRRAMPPVGISLTSDVDDNGFMEHEFDGSAFSKPLSFSAPAPVENAVTALPSNNNVEENIESASETDQDEVFGRAEELVPSSEAVTAVECSNSAPDLVDEDRDASKFSYFEVAYDAEMSFTESDQHSPDATKEFVTEDTLWDLPQLPVFVELDDVQQINERKAAVKRIIESYKTLPDTDCTSQTRMGLLARLVAKIDADDDVVTMLQKHITVDYRQQKGHELVLYILYHLHSLMAVDVVGKPSYAAVMYEKLLLAVAKSLLDAFPASDKSFSRLLGEVPLLSESTLKLLDDMCCSNVFDSRGKEVRDVERVTQGLGAVWGLIIGRPKERKACLDIALKCAVHSQDDVRAKAIRLVANKLYQLGYISENIEHFATNMLLSAVDQQFSAVGLSQSASTEQREGEVGTQETSVSGSHVQSISTLSLPEAQRHISLFFALCTKAVHRHMPILIRTLGPSYSELLHIIANPPEGCENLLMLVVQILTQDTAPSTDLIATVKHLYETKLKDATILIPILSSLSKSEVLPIFPRLVGLPIEKFQMALAHILQGSAHTGPALSPAEVLVAIHGISPEKDGLALKKITEACTACFEQRTVFSQQVLAKALSEMVDQAPLPLLFMRTVIQAIDAFPNLVDFVMEVLTKLVSRQVWKMPKLWVGFMKCVSQTLPHSFNVLLQLPPPQLESALNKYVNLRSPLAAYATQPSVKNSLPRSILGVLGLLDEMQNNNNNNNNNNNTQPSLVSPLQPSNTNSAQGANLT